MMEANFNCNWRYQLISYSTISELSYNILLIRQHPTMRARSGAIHCDSSEDYIQLAEASQNRTGIFYDEKINKKVMNHVKDKRSKLLLESSTSVSNPESSAEKKKDSFLGFDFSLEIQADKQQRQQLQRMNSRPFKQQSVGIISSDPQAIIQSLCKTYGSTNIDESTVRGVDLVMRVCDQSIVKYWIFKRQLIQDGKDMLLDLYLKRCEILFQVKQGQITILKDRIKNNECESILKSLQTTLGF